jgi:antitoxin CptB
MLSEKELKRQIWHSRRGMLELDKLLEPFARHQLPILDAVRQQVYVRLLQQQDPDLFAWFMGHDEAPDPELSDMVNLVKQYVQSR